MALFDKPVVELNTNQLRLLEWLEFYKAVGEIEEKPQDERYLKIDILLDYWLKDNLYKKKKDNKYSRMGKGVRGKNTVKF